MKRTDAYRFAEKCLYEYPANCSKLKSLEQELVLLCHSSDVSGQSYEISPIGRGVHSDPVCAYVERKDRLEHRILSVKRVTEPVQRLMQDLDSDNVLENSKKDDCKKILALFYFGRNGMTMVLNELNCSKSVFYDRRNFLVRSAIQYLGL